MLQLLDFSYFRGTAALLSGIDLHLPPGAYLSVLGPNGAGKSTLLKCLLRLHDGGRSSGEIRVKGRPQSTYGQRALARELAYVPQAGGWIPPFTVEQFARLSRYPHLSAPAGGDDADGAEAARRALQTAGVAAQASRPLRELSGGERQKAFLAAALAQGSELLLLDEPDAFLDPGHTAALRVLLHSLHGEGRRAVITVTHDLNHPLAMGGYALVLREGRQLYFGPATGLLGTGILEQAFAHRFVYCTRPDDGRPLILAE